MQLIASSFVWYQGLRIDTISLNFISSDYSTILLPRIISLVITIIWLAGITNAINWIDGLDGLATSMSISSLLGILFLSFLFNNTILILLTSIIIGICLGFLPHNLNPSKILMGDCGSYFLGFNLASLSLLAISIYNQNSEGLIL